MFSFSFPLIIFPGIIFMIAKDYVDRHNIDHLHEESSIDLSVHLAAANMFQTLGLGKRYNQVF